MSFFTQDIGYTAFDAIIKHTYDEFFTELSGDLSSFANTEATPVQRAVSETSLDKMLFKVSYGDQVHRLGNKYHRRDLVINGGQQNTINNSSMLEMNRIESSLTIKEAIPVIKSIRENIGSSFYGAILVQNGKRRSEANAIVNPLNPLVALAIKEIIDQDNHTMLENKYSIIVYSFRDKKLLRESRLAYLTDRADENHKEDIKDILVGAHLSENLSVIYENPRRFGKTQMRYDETYRDSDGRRVNSPTTNYYMVPVQISNTSGVMYPCYGTVLFDRASAKNLSPHMSANVGTPGEAIGAWSNVCAGSLNSSTDAGKKTFNHSNNTSPLNSHNFGKGGVEYALSCVDIALELLSGDIIAGETVEPVKKRMTLVEYRVEHAGASISEYVEYIRTLNIEELPEWN